ncbi:MAG: hypothetical protein ACRDJM_06090 [Actinomycetota bacterium]
MKCPYCDLEAERRDVHRHLLDEHPERVAVRVDEKTERRFYEVRCPTCDAPWEREIKPRFRDPEFVTTFEEEIKLVAFDMLLYHIQGEHVSAGAAPADGEGTA